ncbi:hypothetical protein Poly59_15020 [Rubripirellula reticaptiva]|uniref:Uncharacterized protein n=1 Tax=Rubripirellula reticaptiva TaxID=2528013 RepID=A0A5C6F277_9BACT|nr:hypothetical protein Poly59_15020 [Rubripirellula reticaptiva]
MGPAYGKDVLISNRRASVNAYWTSILTSLQYRFTPGGPLHAHSHQMKTICPGSTEISV